MYRNTHSQRTHTHMHYIHTHTRTYTQRKRERERERDRQTEEGGKEGGWERGRVRENESERETESIGTHHAAAGITHRNAASRLEPVPIVPACAQLWAHEPHADMKRVSAATARGAATAGGNRLRTAAGPQRPESVATRARPVITGGAAKRARMAAGIFFNGIPTWFTQSSVNGAPRSIPGISLAIANIIRGPLCVYKNK